MRRTLFLTLLALAVLPVAAHAQGAQWSPPSRQMPEMPRASDLRGEWFSSRASWFRGVDDLTGITSSGLRASGEPRPGSDRFQIVRFTQGPLPVVIWSDRNGDDRADMVEIFKSGGVIIQLIDADYDGNANVMRVYDSSGALLRQDRL